MRKYLLAVLMTISAMVMAGERELTVTGKSEIKVRPDITRVTVNVRSPHASYEEAYRVAEENLNQLASVMKDCELATDLPKTSYFNIERKTRPQYDERGNYIGTTSAGYELQQDLRIDLSMDNALLARVVRGLGQHMRDVEVQIAYSVQDTHTAQKQMLADAVSDARAKAELMAEKAGCKLGKVKRIDYSETPVAVYTQARKMAAANDMLLCTESSLDITPDDLRASEEVTVVWYLK